jgi:hypothetical protein
VNLSVTPENAGLSNLVVLIHTFHQNYLQGFATLKNIFLYQNNFTPLFSAFVICLCFCLSNTGYAQNFKWAHKIKENYIGNIGSVTADSQGNFYLQSEYTGTIHHGETPLTSIHSSDYDLMLFKYGQDRNALWYKTPVGLMASPQIVLQIVKGMCMK